MKNLLLFSVFLFVLTVTTYSQVTNLKVNGSSSSFLMASGDLFGWSYDVPTPGDTTLVIIWVDTDQNGVLNPAVDVVWTFFNQVDGLQNTQGGPPDMDGLADGHVSFQQNLGLAPAHYIMVFKNHNNSQSVAGTVTNLVSPAFTISGTVTVPAGMNKANIMLSMESHGGTESKGFWNALTDANGNFSIHMSSDTSGNPWGVITNNNLVFGSAIVTPQGYSLVITPGTPAYTGNNFTVTAASATISGTVRDEFGNGAITEVQANNPTNTINRRVQTDIDGTFKIGLLSSELPNSNVFCGSSFTSNNQYDTTWVTGFFGVSSIKSGDAFTHDITIFKTNSTISGRVLLNGNSPNMNIQLICMNTDTGFVFVNSDYNGNFIAHVSNKIYSYKLGSNSLPPGYEGSSITVHPGETNVIYNVSLVGVKSENSNIPKEYNLAQNYPNPFNPTTTINYSVAKEGMVKLTIYNTLGGKVATLVSENKPAGNYSVQFNASKLASGIYLYKLESGNFIAEKKLILLK